MKLVVPPKVELVTNLESDSDTEGLAASQGKTLSNMVTSTNSQMGSHVGMINAVASDVSNLDNRLLNVETPLKDSSGIFPSSGTNTPSGLVQLDSDGKLPLIDGSNLINVSSSASERFSLTAVNEVNTTYSPSLGSTYSLHDKNSMTVDFGNSNNFQQSGISAVNSTLDDQSSDNTTNSGTVFVFTRPIIVQYSVLLSWASTTDGGGNEITGTQDPAYLYIDVSYDGGEKWESRHGQTSRVYVNDFGFTVNDGWVEIDNDDEHVSRSGTVFFEKDYAIRVRVGYINNESTFDSVRLSLLEV